MSVGQLGKLRPIDNRPTALFAPFAPGSGGNQPPRRLGGYHRQAHWTTNGGIGGYHRQTHSATNGGIHQYPPVSTEAASLPHIAPVFATFMSHTRPLALRVPNMKESFGTRGTRSMTPSHTFSIAASDSGHVETYGVRDLAAGPALPGGRNHNVYSGSGRSSLQQ